MLLHRISCSQKWLEGEVRTNFIHAQFGNFKVSFYARCYSLLVTNEMTFAAHSQITQFKLVE